MIPAALLSAYDADSHKRWAQGLMSACAQSFEWDHHTMPARYFDWRVQGNALHWATQTWRAPKCLVATSMTDLCNARGLVPALNVPALWYAHENQFAYPARPSSTPSPNLMHHQLRSIMGALSSTQVVFNSAFNRRTFLQGARALLNKMPDFGNPGCIDDIEAKSHVLAVPLEDDLLTHHRAAPLEGPVRILWNHRWEYDKAPDRFFEAIGQLDAKGYAFELVVMGQQFKRAPKAFVEAQKRLAHRIVQWGYVPDRSTYRALVASCDLVISTALHEFQGLAVQEAMALGVRPVVPARLAYVEYTTPSDQYASHPDDATQDTRALLTHLEHLLSDTRWRAHRLDFPHQWCWSAAAPAYLDLLHTLTPRTHHEQ